MAKRIRAKAADQTRFYRDLKIDREKIDATKRTVEVAFSSEEPVERWGENEVLGHEKGEFDFSRLNNDHPLLLGHAEYDPKSQIGVIESARVDKDKVGRAVVRFGNSELATEIFQDVQDGIRKLVSVGYDRTGIVESKKAKDGMVTTRYRWQPTHIALVPVPADTTVGVGRDKPEDAQPVDSLKTASAEHIYEQLNDDQKNRMKILFAPDPALPAPGSGTAAPTIDEGKLRTEATSAERSRVSEITSITDLLIKDHGDKNGGALRDKLRTMANDAITKGEAIPDFKQRCLTEALGATPAKPVMLKECTDDPTKYSLMRGIQSALKKKEEGKSPIPDGIEGEVHQEVMNRAKAAGGLGYEAQGFQVTSDTGLRLGPISNRRMARDMQATIFPSGGAFVPTQLVIPIIELLRNFEVLSLLGKRTMAGLQGTIVIPRQEAAATAYSVSEIGALTASQQILGQITLTPKRVGAQQVYSRQFVMQSSPDAEAFMRDDLLKVIGLDWDRLGLNGQGVASEPLGVFNTPGINSIVFGATPTYIKLVAMRTAIRALNVVGNLAFVSTPAVEGTLSGVAEALTGATTVGGAQNAIWKPGPTIQEGRVVGMPAFATNQVPNNQVALGEWDQLIHAIWGGLDVVVDTYTKAGNAEVVLTFNTFGDYVVRHPQAFCVSADAGNQ